MSDKHHRKLPVLPALVVILFLGLVSVSLLYVKTIRSGQSKPETDPVVQMIGKFMNLPSDVPTVTVIDNPDSFLLRDPAFFTDAVKGDKLIAYQTVVILFDTKTRKIKNIRSSAPAPLPPATPLRISIRYNGLSKDRAEKLATELTKFSANLITIETVPSTAVYAGDVVYIINQARRLDIINLARVLGDSPVKPAPEPADAIVTADAIIAFSDQKP